MTSGSSRVYGVQIRKTRGPNKMMEEEEEEEGSECLRYRQRLEKSTGGEVVLMEWSPKMDVLAVALSDHSVRSPVSGDILIFFFFVKVVLYRLSWQRVWMIAPASTSVTAITWRPDGKGMMLIKIIGDGRPHPLTSHTHLQCWPWDTGMAVWVCMMWRTDTSLTTSRCTTWRVDT